MGGQNTNSHSVKLRIISSECEVVALVLLSLCSGPVVCVLRDAEKEREVGIPPKGVMSIEAICGLWSLPPRRAHTNRRKLPAVCAWGV